MSYPRRRCLAAFLFITAAVFGVPGIHGPSLAAQAPEPGEQTSQIQPTEETVEERQERVAAERFLQLLKRRPRLGTALDKVYGFHVGRGSLGEFVESLQAEAESTGDGNIWLILGMVQMQRGQDALAAASLEKAEKLLPEQPLASYYLGKTLVLLGEVDAAAEAMRRAIERKPARADMLGIFQDLGRIYQRTGRADEALKVWEQLEALFPGDVQVQEEIAAILAEEGATEAALERYASLAKNLQDRFRQIEMATRAAELKAQLGRTDAALADFEAQLAVVNPDSWLHRDLRRRIEEIFWSNADVDGLVAYYQKWIEQHPEDVDAMMRIARVLSIQQRMPEAEKWFREAIAKAPSNPELRLALVEALATEDRYADAADEMAALVELQPENADYIVRWGELVFNDTERTEQQRREESNAIWRRLLDQRGDDPVTVARVADLFRGSGSNEAAIEQYRAAIELAPSEPQYREYLGEFLHRLNRKEEALAVWRELASGERRTRDNLVRLSEVFSTFGYAEEALAAISAACEMNPTFGHLARYAELLREASQFDAALAQLDRAEELAEDPELRELVIEERIKNYQASGTLAERIAETESAAQGSQSEDAATWRLLALLRDANRKFQLACDAAAKATELDPGNPLLWETAATIQERAGRFGDAVKSYRKLATLDRRFLSNYLTQIASLEMRMGNIDAALSAGEQLIASAPGNSEHYRYFADLCFRVGQPERGLDVLRRGVRGNPNDQEALLYLARKMAEEFRTEEAIEIYWRAYDLAHDVEGKTAVIEPLTELYLRTNRFQTLLDRLELLSRERNQPREGLLLVAAAHQAAGDLGMAKQLLERLAREDSRNTELLQQLVKLSRLEYDFESAAEYQKRLVAAAPTPENEYQLANILLELNDIDQAEALWMKLSQRKHDSAALGNAISTLLQKEQFDTAAALIEREMSTNASNWEVLGPAMIVYARMDRGEDSQAVAERVHTLNVDPAEPTAKVKEEIARRALRRNANAPRYDPYAQLGEPSRLMQLTYQLKQALAPGSSNSYYGSRNQVFTPSCFQDVQAIAYCVPFVVGGENFDERAHIAREVDQALASEDVEQLWWAIFSLLWQDPRMQHSQPSNERYVQCLDALVELGDGTAASQQLSRLVNQRRQRGNNQETAAEPLSREELEQARKWSGLAARANPQMPNYYDLFLAGELARAGQEGAALKLIDRYIESAQNSSNAEVAMLQAISVMTSDQMNMELSPEMLQKVRKLLTTSLQGLKHHRNPANRGFGQQFGMLVKQLVERDELEEALTVVDEILQWQAARTEKLRPSQRQGQQAQSGPLNYGRVVNGRYEQTVISFPPASGYFSADAIYTMYGLYEACQDDPTRRATVQSRLESWTRESANDPYLGLVRNIASAAFAYWNEDREATTVALERAETLSVGDSFTSLAQARLFFDARKYEEALQVVESLRPTNQKMLVDRELTILQLVLQMGDLERAKRSAQKLFALRLPGETEFKLAELMYQLGMKDLGDRMMGRIRRRAGGNQNTLIQLMNRYAASGEDEAAAEIARQVIRRTSPRGSRNYYTSENQQHEQALRILAQTERLEPLITRYEELVERSPQNTKLVDKLAAFYEAAGRRQDAQQLRIKVAEDSPSDPRSLLAAGQRLAQLRKHDEAVEKYIAAIVKSPALLNDSYYEMRTSFEEAKAWGQLTDALVSAGIRKFRESYRLSEIASELMREKNEEALNRLLGAGLDALSWQELTRAFYSFSPTDVTLNEEVVALLRKRLVDTDESFDGVGQNVYIYSRSSNGRTRGFVQGIASLVTAEDDLREDVAESMANRLEKNERALFPRALLALIHVEDEDFEAAHSAMAPLVQKEEKRLEDALAIWCVASTLTHDAKQPALACDLLESIEDRSIWEQYGSSGFQYTAESLLAYSYEQSGRHAEARRILVQVMETEKIDERQNQYNPGYGEYQYIRSLSSLAQRFLKMGYPAEAFIAYRKAFADKSRLERSNRWGGNLQRERERIEQQIAEKTTAEVILNLVAEAIERTDDSESESQASVADAAGFLTEPEIQHHSLIDVRVSMPLEQFTLKITEDEALRQAVATWLNDHPVDPHASLSSLVTRLLVCHAAEDEAETASTSVAIVAWAERQGVFESNASGTSHTTGLENPQNITGDEPDPPKDAASKETQTAKLPQELLLALAASHLQGEGIDNAQVVALLEYAASSAKSLEEEALADSLQCQIAKHVAETDPDRARATFMNLLDGLLPPVDGTTAGPTAEAIP